MWWMLQVFGICKGVPDTVTLSMTDSSLKQAGLLLCSAVYKTWEAVQSCGFSNQQCEAGWAVYKGGLILSRCLRYQVIRSHHKNSCVKCLCIGSGLAAVGLFPFTEWLEISHLGWGFCPVSLRLPWVGKVPLCGNEKGKRYVEVFPSFLHLHI